MNTHIVTTYSAKELQEQHPRAFARALDRFAQSSDCHWSDEIFDSLKATCKAAGVKLDDWSLGAYSQGNRIRVSFSNEDTEELSGPRAMAWLENNLFGPLRMSWTSKERKECRKYGKYYYAGLIKPCPLTEVCFDEDYLDALRKAVRSGDTLKEAFHGLAQVYQDLAEAEIESMQTPEYFIEFCDGNDMEFTEDGDIF